ncbi:MAG: GNA1162 family protein [Pseudomonadales bacterium]
MSIYFVHSAKKVAAGFGLACIALITGCATTPPYDYTAFEAHKPRSILVLPPVNQSIEVGAPYIYLSRVTQPLAEKGYYVFPVAVIDQLMKENGLPTSTDMHNVPLAKIKEIIDPDAVLYITIDNWGQKYQVISSTTVVKVSGKLVDVDTGTLLWEGHAEAVQQSDDGGGGLIGALVSAAITQIINNKIDHTPQLARIANHSLFHTPDQGLLDGPYREESTNLGQP